MTDTMKLIINGTIIIIKTVVALFECSMVTTMIFGYDLSCKIDIILAVIVFITAAFEVLQASKED